MDHPLETMRMGDLSEPDEQPLDALCTEVYEEETGKVIGTYDPRTQPIDDLMDLVFFACIEGRNPDWTRLPSCPIPEDLRRHVYVVDFRGWAWVGDEEEFPNGAPLDELRAHIATLEPERPFPRLTHDEAVTLDDQVLRERFVAAAVEASGYDTLDEMPADFPWNPAKLNREQMLEIVRAEACWFDPDRGHPVRFSMTPPAVQTG